MLKHTHTHTHMHNLQPPLSGFKACCEVSIRQWRWIQRVLAAAVIAVVPRREELLLFCNLALPFELSLPLILCLSPTYAHIIFFFLSLPVPLSRSGFGLNSSSIMRSFLHCQSVSTYHLNSSTLIEQTSAYSAYCE